MPKRPNFGRPSKGDRDAFLTKPAIPVGEVVRSNAEALGMSYGDYISAIVANHLGLPQYAPQVPISNQEELPLKTA